MLAGVTGVRVPDVGAALDVEVEVDIEGVKRVGQGGVGSRRCGGREEPPSPH